MARIFLEWLSRKQDLDNTLLCSLSVVGLWVKPPSHNRNIRQIALVVCFVQGSSEYMSYCLHEWITWKRFVLRYDFKIFVWFFVIAYWMILIVHTHSHSLSLYLSHTHTHALFVCVFSVNESYSEFMSCIDLKKKMDYFSIRH